MSQRLIKRLVQRHLQKKALAVSEGGFRLNVAKVPLKKARAYAEAMWQKHGIKGLGRSVSVDEAVPDFDRNYMLLQKKLKRALNIPRVQMPVIEPEDMKEFQQRLSEGYIDLFKPYAKGAFQGVGASWGPMDLDEGEEWVEMGVKDGDLTDDKIPARFGKTPARALLPTQAQIWLEKLVLNTAKYGLPRQGSILTKQTVIVSLEGYILDGHHRFGQLMLIDPSLTIKSLKIPLDIDFLLEVGRAYGAAVGRKPKAGAQSRSQMRKVLLERVRKMTGPSSPFVPFTETNKLFSRKSLSMGQSMSLGVYTKAAQDLAEKGLINIWDRGGEYLLSMGDYDQPPPGGGERIFKIPTGAVNA